MRRQASSMLSRLAAGLLLGVSFGVSAAGMSDDTGRWSGDEGYSLDQLAADFAAASTITGTEAGQAGRAGPESVPMMSSTASEGVAWPLEHRYSVYHLAAELEAAKAAGMDTGQAGRAGPESLPAATPDMKIHGRFIIDDRRGGTFW